MNNAQKAIAAEIDADIYRVRAKLDALRAELPLNSAHGAAHDKLGRLDASLFTASVDALKVLEICRP